MSNESAAENMIESHEVDKCTKSAAEQGGGDGAAVGAKIDGKSNDLNAPKAAHETARAENGTPGIVTKNIENDSLNSILAYGSDSDSSDFDVWQVRDEDDDDDDDSQEDVHVIDDDSDSSSEEEDDEEDSSNDSDSTEDDSPNEDISVMVNKGAIKKDKPSIKVPGELGFDELPPVPDLSTLSISVEDEKFIHMGTVLGIVDKLVTVESIPNIPAYDLDTLLFLDNGKKPMGYIFDVLGQVTSPIYAVRFNSVEDIKKLGIEVGSKVYCAPMSKHTQYVFLQQLLKMKGSDASWLGDNEVPLEFADFSDDENERCQRRAAKRQQAHVKRTHSDDGYKQFENTMNKRNILNTKFNKYMDSYKQSRLHRQARSRRETPGFQMGVLPVFNPAVPPPNVRPHMSLFSGSGVPPELLGFSHLDFGDPSASTSASSENNNMSMEFYPRVLVNNIRQHQQQQVNSSSYFTTNHAPNNHPGPSHQ